MDNRPFLLLGLGVILLLFTDKSAQAVIMDKVETLTSGKTRGERNNNPGNIEINTSYTWQGQIGIDSSGIYLIFDNAINGIRAIAKDLLSKNNRGLDTITGIISAYAPPSENNTDAYIRAVSNDLRVSSIDSLDLTDFNTLQMFVQAIIKHENGRVAYDGNTIFAGVNAALSG